MAQGQEMALRFTNGTRVAPFALELRVYSRMIELPHR
jgi:hypothetical protein